MKRIGTLTLVIFVLAMASFGIAAKKTTTVKRLIANFSGHPVSGFATVDVAVGGKAKKPKKNLADEISSLFSLSASAQSVAVPSLRPQSFEGICNEMPAQSLNGVVAFGVGRTEDSHCQNDQQNISTFGPLVIEDGTLGGLVCAIDGQGGDATDGVCELFVYRRGVGHLDTGINCVIGFNPDQFCQAAAGAFPVVTGDRPYARFRFFGGAFSHLQITFQKT